jgi:hypothetical protein
MLTKEDRTLTELRLNAFNEKLRQARPVEPVFRKAGTVIKKQEIPEGMMEVAKQVENTLPMPKTVAEEQNDLEAERAWIRKRNCKIYDNKIQNLAANTTNGSELLKQEIT